jgi:hypothetical protein
MPIGRSAIGVSRRALVKAGLATGVLKVDLAAAHTVRPFMDLSASYRGGRRRLAAGGRLEYGAPCSKACRPTTPPT